MKCKYPNACSTGNKQDELKICVQLQGDNLPGITEIWWDGSHYWSVSPEGQRLFRKGRLGR